MTKEHIITAFITSAFILGGFYILRQKMLTTV